MSPRSTSGLSVELLLRVINVKYGSFTFLYFWDTIHSSSGLTVTSSYFKLYTLEPSHTLSER